MTDIIYETKNLSSASLSAYNDQYFADLVKTHLTSSNNNEEFYSKLIELKNEQKKTLSYMQDLYNEKQRLKEGIINSELCLNNLKSTSYSAQDDSNYKFDLNTVSAYENRPLEFDSSSSVVVNNVSSKPPLPHKLASSVTFETASISDDLEKDISEDLKKIEKIWNEFKMDEKSLSDLKSLEFNNRFEKKRVNSALTSNNRRVKNSNRSSYQYEWFPRVTIPEPFSMTIREQMKSEKKNQKLVREMQDEREKRIDAELKESHRKFKAQPVPAHVYLPLYEKHKINEEMRKQKLKQVSKDYLLKVSKPFQLTKSTRERRHSYSEGQEDKKYLNDFVAQPMPDFYYNDEDLNERVKEEEALKQLKSKVRAVELLKQSKLPHSMELNEKKKKLEYERSQFFMQEMNRLQKEAENSKDKPKKSYDVPDYDELYKKFVIEFERNKAKARKNTKVEPFILSESRVRESDFKNEFDDRNQRPNSMARLNKSLSTSMDAFPTKSTQSQKNERKFE